MVQIRRAGGKEFQIVGAATLKLQAPNEVWTYSMRSNCNWFIDRTNVIE